MSFDIGSLITKGLGFLTSAGQGPVTTDSASPEAGQEAHHVIQAKERQRTEAAENLADPQASRQADLAITPEFKQAVKAAHDPQASAIERVERKVDLLSKNFGGLIGMLNSVFASVAPLISMLGLGGSPEPAAAPSVVDKTAKALHDKAHDPAFMNGLMSKLKPDITAQPTAAEAAEIDKLMSDPAMLQQLLEGLGGAAPEAQQSAASTAKPVVAEMKPNSSPTAPATQQDAMAQFLKGLGLDQSAAVSSK